MIQIKVIKYAAVAIIAASTGFFTARGCAPVASKQPEPLVQVEQKVAQKSDSKCVIRNIVKPDGTKEQTLESSNEVSQDATQHVQIFPKQEPRSALLAGGYVNSNFTFGVSIGLNTPEWDLDLSSDLKTDHRLTGKKVLLRW